MDRYDSMCLNLSHLGGLKDIHFVGERSGGKEQCRKYKDLTLSTMSSVTLGKMRPPNNCVNLGLVGSNPWLAASLERDKRIKGHRTCGTLSKGTMHLTHVSIL